MKRQIFRQLLHISPYAPNNPAAKWGNPPPPGGDLTLTFSERLTSPIFKTARLRKKTGAKGGNGPLKVEKITKN